MEDTLDLWEIPAESATRVGHPAPFPVELPARLIDLYTYRGDLVLDPFAGSGTTAVAAVRTGRHYVGYDLDEGYVRLAEERVEHERRRLGERPPPADVGGAQGAAIRAGRAAKGVAVALLEAAGFTDIESDQRQPGGVTVDVTARGPGGARWLFDVAGGFTTYRGGLKRSDALWRALGRAAVLREVGGAPLVLLTTGRPTTAGPAADALRAVTGPGRAVHAVVDMLDPAAVDALGRL